MKQVTITTDGGCWPNPGRGGWAAVLRFGSACKEICGRELETTNNRMELRAIIEGLRALREPCAVLIRTDSRNAMNWCAPKAFAKEKQRNKQPVAYEMVLEFRALAAQHEIRFEWVRGHTGDPDNERCDKLAADQIAQPF